MGPTGHWIPAVPPGWLDQPGEPFSSISFPERTRLSTTKPDRIFRTFSAFDAGMSDWVAECRFRCGKLAFTCEIELGNQEICAVNRDGTGLVRLTSRPAPDKEPAWHPDGTRIAFSSNHIVVHMAPDGTDLVHVIGGESPAWSPTGDRLALIRNGTELGIVNADGSGFRVIVPGNVRAPGWRP